MYRLRTLLRAPQTTFVHAQRRTLTRTTAARYQARSEYRSGYQLHPRRVSNCLKCSTPLPTSLPTCTNRACGYIAPIPEDLKSDYFALFDLPGLRPRDVEGGEREARNAFNIDPKELRNRFLKMQKACHPDRWEQSGEGPAALAASQSAQINKAYQTLLSPRLRGEYILSRQGIDISEADNMDDEQELMMEVMEAREELENAEGEEVNELLAANKGRIETAVMELENALAMEDWEEARRAVIRLRYWESFQRAGTGQGSDH